MILTLDPCVDKGMKERSKINLLDGVCSTSGAYQYRTINLLNARLTLNQCTQPEGYAFFWLRFVIQMQSAWYGRHFAIFFIKSGGEKSKTAYFLELNGDPI